MDRRPFFEFNMLEFTDQQVKELRRFKKELFEPDSTVIAARKLKYTAKIIRLLSDELSQPSDAFLKYVVSQVYDGRATSVVLRMFTELTHSAFNQFINDKIQARLTSALNQENENTNVKAVELTKRWVSITDYNLPPGSPPPTSLRFWDDELRSIEAWV